MGQLFAGWKIVLTYRGNCNGTVHNLCKLSQSSPQGILAIFFIEDFLTDISEKYITQKRKNRKAFNRYDYLQRLAHFVCILSYLNV